MISRTPQPVTQHALIEDLQCLGVEPGMVLLVHSSLSSIGWVVGGAQAVVAALQQAVGEAGTLVMPTHSSQLSDPAKWECPPVPADWWEDIRSTMPAFDPDITPTRQMGAIVECFRDLPGARRSAHPALSFAAVGPQARTIVAGHEVGHGLDDRSPLGCLYALDAHVLLLGVGHGNNTSLHLAETRAAIDLPLDDRGAPMLVEGERRWVRYQEPQEDSSDFAALGEAFDATGQQVHGLVGSAPAMLLRQRAVVDFAVSWFEQHRAGRPPAGPAEAVRKSGASEDAAPRGR